MIDFEKLVRELGGKFRIEFGAAQSYIEVHWLPNSDDDSFLRSPKACHVRMTCQTIKLFKADTTELLISQFVRLRHELLERAFLEIVTRVAEV